MEGKLAMFLQAQLAFAFQPVLKDTNSACLISSFLVQWFPIFYRKLSKPLS